MKYIYPQPIAKVTHIPTPAPLVALGLKRLLPPSLIHTRLSECPILVKKKFLAFLCLFENKNQEKQKSIYFILLLLLFLHCYYIIAPRSPTHFSCHQNVVIEHTVF